ncbi:4-(cytidine 5'-diphospho)-2-C-methyl-D-erythritol kinase [uncultured Nocardioides sp.]|uniref:4-(cytidine 5'-diphospho)-2-C-methyl-D-erythritol kinase n=1 Tax=uncultured Nocardioides sp. TaxID=198441 RepID=UPI0025DB2A8B|nr:4-(cytidine 5'-diphospho)-2-C-methyl-D-erythritol kinase [uncultured Nocardioides sp.]
MIPTSGPPGSVTVRAPAKINLHLGVGAPRGDGFHPLLTVYHAIGIYDDVTVRPSDSWRLTVETAPYLDVTAVPLGDDNIVVRAATLLADLHGVPAHADVLIRKEIPVAGGMAGGSADAAAVLVALDRLWGLDTSDEDMFRLAAELGSDVPFALMGGNVLGTGRGEVVESVRGGDVVRWWVVVTAREGLSTPAVYRRFDAMAADASPRPSPPHRLVAFLADPVEAITGLLHNDLQEPALDLRPELRDVLAAGEKAGALAGLVSGSGPTCVFLCSSADHARGVAAGLDGVGEHVLVANGPVAGAHVVEHA